MPVGKHADSCVILKEAPGMIKLCSQLEFVSSLTNTLVILDLVMGLRLTLKALLSPTTGTFAPHSVQLNIHLPF